MGLCWRSWERSATRPERRARAEMIVNGKTVNGRFTRMQFWAKAAPVQYTVVRSPQLVHLYVATNTGIGEGVCTVEEAHSYRKRLRVIGGDRFLDETINAGAITAKKLCTAFGILPPSFLENAPDQAYYSILNLGIHRELSKRVKLEQYNTVDDAVSLLKKSRKIMVITGAGVRPLDLLIRA